MSSSVALQDLAALRPRASRSRTVLPLEGSDKIPVCITGASAGDHHQIHQLLQSVFHGPDAVEFHAQLEDPTYEPVNRLVVRRGRQIVGHCRIIERTRNFGSLQLPVSELADVATKQEYRGRGYGTALLRAAEKRLRQDGIQFAMLKTDCPDFYERMGWVESVRHSYSTGRARDILAVLSAAKSVPPSITTPLNLQRKPESLTIRLWRHVELDALMQLYAENIPGAFGRTLRTDAHWRWLITRRGFDRILIAIRGTGKMQLDESTGRIEGYAAMSGSRILEMMATTEDLERRQEVLNELVARACGDAIERDDEVVGLDAPPNDPLHRLFVSAGGSFHARDLDRQLVTMTKIIQPQKVLEILRPLLFERARTKGINRPAELGLQVDDESYVLMLMPRSVKLREGRQPRSFLSCSRQEFDRLVLGYGNVSQAIEEGRLKASTQVAARLAGKLFPMIPMWRPPLDEMPAQPRR